MEDCNMLAADCVVISCCCQCLMLQILVLVLRKLVRKTREYAKRIIRQRKGKSYRGMQSEMGCYKDVLVRIQAEMALKDDARHNCGCCMEEVEKVMEEFYEKGEFAFGNWGRKGSWGVPTIVNDHNDDDNFVRYQIIDMVDSLSCA
ncbi:putative transmembrane protein [Sesbania bispinosa]|nr:putative transmembrane protein [Sesbania bispinosa]